MVGFIYEDFIPMAILRADEEDSNNPQGMNQPNTNSTGSQPVEQTSISSAPGTATPASTASAAQAANQPNPKASSGTFTNLRQYINANQGNKIGSAVGQKVSNTATGAQKSIEQGQTSFGQKVEQGTLANRENAVSDIKSIVQKARGVSAQPQTAPAPAAQPQAAPNTINPVPVVAPAAAPAAAPDYTQGLDTQRFQDVINAQYKGPESLRSSGLYDPISQKVQTAQSKINQAQTASGREDLLKDTFSQNRQYNRGQNKLDSLLLNTSKEGVQGLLDQRAKAGNLQQALQSAENTSSNLATNRANEIKGLQSQARETFTGEQKAEREATDARLANVVQDWDKLPEYFKDILRNKEKDNTQFGAAAADKLKAENNYSTIQQNLAQTQNLIKQKENSLRNIKSSGIGDWGMPNYGTEEILQYTQTRKEIADAEKQLANYNSQKSRLDEQVSALQSDKRFNLSPEEAAMLGIQSGEGLYNLGEEAIRTNLSDKEKLISRDEQARQFALSQLAGLDTSRMLDTNVKYSDLAKAGTQTAADALNLQGTRDAINEAEKNFREQVQGQEIVGTGSKKNKTSGKRYYAQESANLGDILKRSGYNFEAPMSSQVGNINAAGSTQYDSDVQSGVGGAVEGLTSPIAGGSKGTGVVQKAADLYGSFTGLNALTGALGMGSLGGAVSSLFGGGSSSKESKSDAAKIARKDLQNKVTNVIRESGFQNRANVADTEQTRSRSEALRAMLAKMDKTNA
jgi:hypothetical protein